MGKRKAYVLRDDGDGNGGVNVYGPDGFHVAWFMDRGAGARTAAMLNKAHDLAVALERQRARARRAKGSKRS